MFVFWVLVLFLFAIVIHVQSTSTSSQTTVHSTANASPKEVIPDLNIPLEEPSIQSDPFPKKKETKYYKMLRKLKDKGVLAEYRRESRMRNKTYRSNLTVEERKAISYKKNKASKQRLLAVSQSILIQISLKCIGFY